MRISAEDALGGRGIVGSSASVVLDSTVIRASAARTLADLLSSRVAGVNVTYATGAPGFAPEVTTRGAATLFGSARPLLYIDGILQREDPHELGPRPDGHRPAHAWSLPIEEIESVEVILGAAGGTLLEYGTARGAVLVRTRRPTPGPITLRSFVESLALEPGMEFPDVLTTTADNTPFCTIARQATGFCTPTGTRRWRALGGDSPLRTGIGTRAGISASGGSSRLGFRLSALGDQGAGQIVQSGMERVDLAAALVGRIRERVEVTLDARYARSAGEYAHWGENGLLDVGATIWQQGGSGDPPDSTKLDSTLAHSLPYRTQRTTLGLVASWHLSTDLAAFARFGTDRIMRVSSLTEGLGCASPGPTSCLYHRTVNRSDQTGTGGTVGIRGARRLKHGMQIAGEAGAHVSLLDRGEYAEDSWFRDSSYSGNQRWSYPDVRSRSLYGTARWDLSPNRFIAAGIRTERTEFWSRAPKQQPFLTAEVGWTLSGERFIPRNRILPIIRLRAAYGESGDQEDELAVFAVNPFLAGPVVERRTRILSRELGIDASLGNKALEVRATAFDRSVGGAMIPSTVGIFTGNAWATHGVEMTLSPREVAWGAVRWRSTLSLSTAQTRQTRFVGLSETAYWSRVTFVQGAPSGTIHTYGYTWADTNSDGVIVDAELTRDTVLTRRGVVAPTRLLGFTSSVAWGDHLTAGIGIEGKGGHVKADVTRFMRCLENLCRASYDSTTSLDDQAAAIVDGGLMAPVYDATFVRIRELWVRYALPSRFVPRGMTGATLNVAAHQLATWTRYPAGDPETGAFREGNVQHWDLYTPRVPRTFSVRLELVR